MVMPAEYLTSQTHQVNLIFVSGRVTPIGAELLSMPTSDVPRAEAALMGHQAILGTLDGWVRIPDDHEHTALLDEPTD